MPLAARILVLALALMAATCGQKGPLTPPSQSGLAPKSEAIEAAMASQSRVAARTAIEAAHGA